MSIHRCQVVPSSDRSHSTVIDWRSSAILTGSDPRGLRIRGLRGRCDYTARVAAVSGATPSDRLVAPGVARSVALKVVYLTMRNLEEYRQSNVGTRSSGWKQALQRNSQDLWIGVPR
jgi:hypothetical protein